MGTVVKQTKYKDMDAVSIENDLICAKFIPSQGAKLCSIVYKDTGKEFMLQREGTKYRKSKYGESYLEGECSGFDDMFPTIDEFLYAEAPWKDVKLPDHGELWAIPWNSELEEHSICLKVKGVRLPYEIEKRITFIAEDTLLISYRLKNLCEDQMEGIWAAHMMMESEKGCKFKFPDVMSKAYCTISDSKLIGEYGDKFYYPLIKQKSGEIYDMSIHRGMDISDYQKFYFADKMSEGWAKILYPDGHEFSIAFPKESVPYLGAIQGEGGRFNIRCMFLEPCTGAFDRPDIAKQYKMNSLIKPFEELSWTLEIRIAKSDKIKKYTN